MLLSHISGHEENVSSVKCMLQFCCFTQVAVVPNNRTMNELPKVEGLLSYRSDDKKLYLKQKAQWQALATQKDVSYNV